MEAQVRRDFSVLVAPEAIPAHALAAVDDADALTYDAVTNFTRASKGAASCCTMCGLAASGTCFIPRQNKDVCRDCDKALWRHSASGAYFKWCKGCKNFLQVGNFSQKLDAAKCDRCRERGRTSYLLKKRSSPSLSFEPSAPCESPCAAPRLARLAATTASCAKAACGESVADSSDAALSLITFRKSAPAEAAQADVKAEAPSTPCAAPSVDGILSSSFGKPLARALAVSETAPLKHIFASGAQGMLFELAAVHARILALECKAARVGPLARAVAQRDAKLATMDARLMAVQVALRESKAREEDCLAKIAHLEQRAASGACGEKRVLSPVSSEDEQAYCGSKRPRIVSMDEALPHDETAC